MDGVKKIVGDNLADGYIKLHRKTLQSNVFKNASLLKFFIWCLLKANYTESDFCPDGTQQIIHLIPGQFIFGRKSASKELKMNESTVYRYLNQLVDDGMLEVETNNKFSLITIVNWDVYQFDEMLKQQQNVEPEPPKETKKDTREEISEIISYLNQKANKRFKTGTSMTVKYINGRLSEGYTVEDFKKVISTKVDEWTGTKWEQYLAPRTLFAPSNFERYLNNTKIKKEFAKDSDEYRLSEYFLAFLKSIDSHYKPKKDIHSMCSDFDALLEQGRQANEIYIVMKKLFTSDNSYLIQRNSESQFFCRNFASLCLSFRVEYNRNGGGYSK